MNEQERSEIVAESTRSMIAGIGDLNRGAWESAIGHFRQATALRETLPWREDAECAWMLAAAWINQGDALLRAGGAGSGPAAIACFDRTIEAMGRVPLANSPAFSGRLILAWINRATALGDSGDVENALASFAEAERLLGEWGAAATAEHRFMGAMLCTNHARLLLAAGRALEGWQDARHAVEILRTLGDDPQLDAAGIRSRSIQCHALAMLLDEPGGVERAGDWIAQATDSAEEALALVRRSGYSEEWVPDLVRYGAKIYLTCQPQFLGEFLTEWLAGDGPLARDAELRGEMKNVLLLGQVEVERKVLLLPQDTEFVEKQLRILKSLQRAAGCL